MEMAAATGNISAILNQIVDASSLTVDDYVQKSLGFIRHTYYLFVDIFHTRPKDLIDMVDGLLYIECKGYMITQERNKMERQLQERQNHG